MKSITCVYDISFDKIYKSKGICAFYMIPAFGNRRTDHPCFARRICSKPANMSGKRNEYHFAAEEGLLLYEDEKKSYN